METYIKLRYTSFQFKAYNLYALIKTAWKSKSTAAVPTDNPATDLEVEVVDALGNQSFSKFSRKLLSSIKYSTAVNSCHFRTTRQSTISKKTEPNYLQYLYYP
ncbi:hypothetical protein CEXT_480771 [Caerostris extrusa]|uniref:Uncharacterized protein n=1 Tax=Caerostris extrusa TaxID=172846 RepID=A0AAV4WWM5_CAEEX|nr:hypothetical protein CEXT_480771 [Caerostris extrusa]